MEHEEEEDGGGGGILILPAGSLHGVGLSSGKDVVGESDFHCFPSPCSWEHGEWGKNILPAGFAISYIDEFSAESY